MRLFEGTEFDRPPRCEKCDRLEEECTCPPEPPFQIPPEQQTAQLAVEKRKKGKLVTVVKGLPEEGNNLPELLTRLKSTCGTGGTFKEGALELQGNHLDTIRTVLQKIGYRVKG